jgi:2-iminobutanoate/2-iminopropanoate deaminase
LVIKRTVENRRALNAVSLASVFLPHTPARAVTQVKFRSTKGLPNRDITCQVEAHVLSVCYAKKFLPAPQIRTEENLMEPKFVFHEPPRRYSKACVYGDLIFLAGEDSKDPTTQKVQGNNVAEQADFLFRNMKATLESLGSSLTSVIKTTVYLKDPRDRASYQEARAKCLPQTPPSTLIMGVQLAEPEMLIEIDAIAVIPGAK